MNACIYIYIYIYIEYVINVDTFFVNLIKSKIV
jgi:hypothetical protein